MNEEWTFVAFNTSVILKYAMDEWERQTMTTTATTTTKAVTMMTKNERVEWLSGLIRPTIIHQFQWKEKVFRFHHQVSECRAIRWYATTWCDERMEWTLPWHELLLLLGGTHIGGISEEIWYKKALNS